jgi:hypothetical protein
MPHICIWIDAAFRAGRKEGPTPEPRSADEPSDRARDRRRILKRRVVAKDRKLHDEAAGPSVGRVRRPAGVAIRWLYGRPAPRRAAHEP